MKTFKFSLVLRTHENTDVFISLDDNIYGIHSRGISSEISGFFVIAFVFTGRIKFVQVFVVVSWKSSSLFNSFFLAIPPMSSANQITTIIRLSTLTFPLVHTKVLDIVLSRKMLQNVVNRGHLCHTPAVALNSLRGVPMKHSCTFGFIMPRTVAHWHGPEWHWCYDYYLIVAPKASCYTISAFLTFLTPRRPKHIPLQTVIIQMIPVSILRKSISGRHRPVRVADGPMTARCRFT